mgnify:CR=1 FL=1
MKLNDLIKQVNDEHWPPELDQDFKNTVDKDAIKKLKKDQLKQVSDILNKIDYWQPKNIRAYLTKGMPYPLTKQTESQCN